MMNSVGLIGYGDFGKLFVKHINKYVSIKVYSPEHEEGNGSNIENVQFVALSEVAKQEVIVIAIPSQNFPELLQELSPLLRPGSLVVDVASVKVKPVEYMLKYLPDNTQILATHPLFGPYSARNGLEGLKMMIYPVRMQDGELLEKIEKFITELKISLIHKTPEEHDKEMAYVQGLSHYIGRTMQEMDIPESELSTTAYEALLNMKKIQGSDSWELFASIHDENPYVEDVLKKFKDTMSNLDQKLQSIGTKR